MSNLRYIAMLFFGILLSVFVLNDFNTVLSGHELDRGFGFRGLIHDLAGKFGIIAFDIALVIGFIWYVKQSVRNSKEASDANT